MEPFEESVDLFEESNVFENTSADLTSMESISLEQSSDGQAKRAPLRTSKRRVQKTTAVVLNADRLRRFEESAATLDDSLISQPTCLSRADHFEDSSILDTIPERETYSSVDDLIMKRRAAKRITHWWRTIKSSRLLLQASPSRNVDIPIPSLPAIPEEEVPPSLALPEILHRDKLFGMLLGHRVRKIMKCFDIVSIINEQKDVKIVFCDLVGPRMGLTGLHPDDVVTHWIASRKAPIVDASRVLSGADHSLASSLLKQLLAEREKLLASVFRNSEWSPWPRPGYWRLDYTTRLKKIKQSAANPSFQSPPRSGQKHIQETPPHVKSAMAQRAKVPVKLFVARNNNKLLHEESFEESHLVHEQSNDSSFMPAKVLRPLKDAMEEKAARSEHDSPPLVHRLHSQDRPITASPASSMGVHNSRASYARPQTASHPVSTGNRSSLSQRPSTSASSGATAVYQSTKRRGMEGGHIQLDIISGDRLMPARKGAVPKDSHVEPDRKPCLKFSLSLPATTKSSASTSSSINGFRKTFQTARDFEVITLNPTWDCTVNIPLPFLKSTLKHLLDADIHEISSTEYEKICRALLEYWCGGNIVVEVVDGERFNEEIFMGQVKILLTSFMPLIKKLDDLEIKGTFQLEKSKISDRVSGSIRLHAYLHAPSKQYLEDQLAQLRASGGVESSRRRSVNLAPSRSGKGAIEDAERPPSRSRAHHLGEEYDDSTPSQRRARSGSRSHTPSSNERQHITVPSSNPSSERDAKEGNSGARLQFASRFMQEIAASIEQINLDLNGFDESLAEMKLEESENIVMPAKGLARVGSKLSQRAKSVPSERERRHVHLDTPSAQEEVVAVDPSKMAKIKAGRMSRNRPNLSEKASRSTTAGAQMHAFPSSPPPVTDHHHASAAHAVLHPSSSAATSTTSSSRRASVLQNVSVSAMVGQETALESRMAKRNFLSDMAKQLDGLSAIQHSADVALENFNQLLAAKIKSKSTSEQEELDDHVLLNYSQPQPLALAPPPPPRSPPLSSQPMLASSTNPRSSPPVLSPVSQGRRTPIAEELEDSDRPQMEDSDEEHSSVHSDDYADPVGEGGDHRHYNLEDEEVDDPGEHYHGYHSEDYGDEEEASKPPAWSRPATVVEESFDSFEAALAAASRRCLDEEEENEDHELQEDELRVIPSPPPAPFKVTGGPGIPGWKPPPPPPRKPSEEDIVSYGREQRRSPPIESADIQSPDRREGREPERDQPRTSPRWRSRIPRATLELDKLDLDLL